MSARFVMRTCSSSEPLSHVDAEYIRTSPGMERFERSPNDPGEFMITIYGDEKSIRAKGFPILLRNMLFEEYGLTVQVFKEQQV